ncbi:hypothetical protein BSKO_09047 [Bryopsis sp. KO-2023]|nr:hypothetical protein BSKO_09047 [Bryopsis sp. KO-2023]
MPGDKKERSPHRCATCPARNREARSSSDDNSQDADLDGGQSVRSCGDLVLSDAFTESGTTPELGKVPLFTGDAFHDSVDPDSDDYFGGEIEATTFTFNVQEMSTGKVGYRSRDVLLADRYGSPTGEITARVVVATTVSLLWNAGCFLLVLYTSLFHSVGEDSESSLGSPWLVVLLAPLIVIGGVLTISVGLEWQKIYMHRRLISRRSVTPVGDVENQPLAFPTSLRPQD